MKSKRKPSITLVDTIHRNRLTIHGLRLVEHFEKQVIGKGIPVNTGTKAYIAFVHQFKNINKMSPKRFILENPHLHADLWQAYCESTGQTDLLEAVIDSKSQAGDELLDKVVKLARQALDIPLVDRDLKLTVHAGKVLDMIEKHKESPNTGVQYYRKTVQIPGNDMRREDFILKFPGMHRDLIMAFLQFSLKDELQATESINWQHVEYLA